MLELAVSPVRRRSVRQGMRAHTISIKRMTRRELAIGAAMYPPVEEQRPRTRGECVDGERPCPWVSCRHHMFLAVDPETGSLKIVFPDREPDELAETCALDVADRGEHQLEQIGVLMNITRERVRQLELIGLHALKSADDVAALAPNT